MRFDELNIIEPLLRALDEKGYTQPTEIQQKAIPLILERHDLLACAQTGTGKTAAFSLPIVQLIKQIEGSGTGSAPIRSLIITPTRELAIQIGENLEAYGKYTAVKHAVIFGGVKQGKQVNKLERGVQVLVATPGRLLDLIDQGYIDLGDVKLLVLDEADRMLDMGFIRDIQRIIALVPKERQTLLFSATMPKHITDLARNYMISPKSVNATPVSSAAETVEQLVYFTNRLDKKNLLRHILSDHDIDHVLLFTRTKRRADNIARFLNGKKIKAAAIHGDKAQNNRQRTLANFKTGDLKVLVATDIAARGIDVDSLRYVINFDIPNVPETYVHRIGRTGRKGESGIAISLSDAEENAYIRDIEKLIKNKISRINDHPFPQTDKPMTNEEKKKWNKEKLEARKNFRRKRSR